MQKKACCIWLMVLFIIPIFIISANADEAGIQKDYTIGYGDILNISVWKNPALTKRVVVLPDGKFSFPLIGEVTAYGKSASRIKKEMSERIERYVPDPILNVDVYQVNSMVIYVIGRVNKPGHYIISSNINIMQALTIAGGLTPFAERDEIKIFRKEKSTTKIFNFDYDEVASGKNLINNIPLKRGDLIVVP